MVRIPEEEQPPHSRDMRVLSVLLLLRHLMRDAATPVHIIGENQEDMTSVLAMVPRQRPNHAKQKRRSIGEDAGCYLRPDFVNTQVGR